MASSAHHTFTFDECVALEKDSGTKHELPGGQMWAIAGGTPEHAAVMANVA